MTAAVLAVALASPGRRGAPRNWRDDRFDYEHEHEHDYEHDYEHEHDYEYER